MILTHANVYCEIVFISFVTDNTAAKSASSPTEHPCEVWHFQLKVTIISPPLILYKLNSLPVYHPIRGSMSIGYAVFKIAIIHKFKDYTHTRTIYAMYTIHKLLDMINP